MNKEGGSIYADNQTNDNNLRSCCHSINTHNIALNSNTGIKNKTFQDSKMRNRNRIMKFSIKGGGRGRKKLFIFCRKRNALQHW